MKTNLENIEGCFLGLAVGDALGVPVEFSLRSDLKKDPVKTMMGHGTWDQQAGTWSDDSSLTFCLASCLTNGYNINAIGESFLRWMKEGYWSARGNVFDIGGATRIALQRIAIGESPLRSGQLDVDSNGNGSLMRIVPASLYFFQEEDDSLAERVREISGITHGHFRSVFSCFIFSKLTANLFRGQRKFEAYKNCIDEISGFVLNKDYHPAELSLFKRTLSGALPTLPENEISSTGYVLHTLEASIWCFLNSEGFEEAVLKAVNLGGDTDTTGCVTGALAGLYYGAEQIPVKWTNTIARKEDIIRLSKDFQNCMDKMILA